MKYLSFILFFATVVITFGGINFYFIKKHRSAVSGSWFPAYLLRLLLLTLITSPIITVIFSINDVPVAAAFFGFIGYSWLAFLFLFLAIHGLVDVILFSLQRLKVFPHHKMALPTYCATILLSVAILVFGSFEAEDIQVEQVELQNSHPALSGKDYKIVQISDVHFSPLTGLKSAQKLKAMIEKIAPDILISTGDMLDRGVRDKEKVIEVLKSIQPPLGKIAIMGNHEYYYGLDRSTYFIQSAGFTLLRDQTTVVDGVLNFVGIDDRTANRYGLSKGISERALLNSVDSNNYTIMLKHQPRVLKDSVNDFELQLSGHTHAGQIFPFSLLVGIVFSYLDGIYQIDQTSKIYVNRGTGTWGPPFRFLAPPEITVFNLKGI